MYFFKKYILKRITEICRYIINYSSSPQSMRVVKRGQRIFRFFCQRHPFSKFHDHVLHFFVVCKQWGLLFDFRSAMSHQRLVRSRETTRYGSMTDFGTKSGHVQGAREFNYSRTCLVTTVFRKQWYAENRWQLAFSNQVLLLHRCR